MRQNKKQNMTIEVTETGDIETGCTETSTIIGNPSLLTMETAFDGNASETHCEYGNQRFETQPHQFTPHVLNWYFHGEND